MAQGVPQADQALLEDLVAANRILYAKNIVDGLGHVSVRHAPRSLNCCAGRVALFSTRFQNMLARVPWAMVASSHLCAEHFA